MQRMRTARSVAGIAAALVLVGCTSDPTPVEYDERVVQLGAPGQSNVVLSSGLPPAVSAVTEEDVAFVQGMIVHHQQALAMTALVADRSQRTDLPLLAERIDVSQNDELAQLRGWLDKNGQLALREHGHGDAMPGMLTEAELAQLTAAEGAEFDTLFLQYMIRHHEGAVMMVEQLLASDKGGQDSEVFQFAQHIDSDQRVEIARMKSLLTEIAG